jgi:phage tail-like protein
MANASPTYPFAAFSFSIEILLPGRGDPLCAAAFAECDGLEVNMELKTIREGGNNDTQVRFAGPLAFGTMTLKRGMTTNFDLWTWFQSAADDPTLRATARVVILNPVAQGAGARKELCHFEMSRCLPQKLKAPALNARDGIVAIEELQVAYETLKFQTP